MTKEDLRKQATSTVEWENTPVLDRPLFVHAYITGAKSRENRIEELEKENVEMKEQLNKAKELIQDLIDSLEVIDGEKIRELKVVKEAEQFLINLERYENGK